MKNLLLAACIMSLLFINACKEHRVDYDTTVPMAQPNFSDTANTNATVQQIAPLVSESDENNLKLNPEHGQPGHRCDIAVGAPLSSPAQKVQPTPTAPTQNLLNNTDAAVTLNPPHGQPGHDCAIPVGQPLKS